MGGNWGHIPIRRSGGSRRRRIILSVVSLIALVVLVKVTQDFFTGGGAPAEIWLIAGMLVVGVVWGLRPWEA